MKCFNCIHQKLCFNLIGGMNLQIKVEDCKDYLGVDEDVWVPPCKKDNNFIYTILDGQIYRAQILYLEATQFPTGIRWYAAYHYIDEFGEIFKKCGTYRYDWFKTKEDAEKFLKEKKK